MSVKPVTKLEQFYYENLGWRRMLDYFKQENTILKNRLSEVVDHSTDRDFLALAEHFQSQFIIKDEFIDELYHDINEQEQILKPASVNSNTQVQPKNIKKQEKLRNEMEYLEKDFTRLKNEFNKYLLSIL